VVTPPPAPWDPEACRRLTCDGAVTRVLVTRQPTTHDPGSPRNHDGLGGDGGDGGLVARLRMAAALLPPVLAGAPSEPLDVGRASRVVQPGQRSALAVRDGGCVFPGCDRPLAWCEAHHLIHWLDGGPTDLANLALLCRAHHRAIHEGGWRLARAPDGRLTATPPQRPHRKQSAA
jgi:HNH endonuclease